MTNLSEALENLKSTDAWKAILDDLDVSTKYRKDNLLWFNADMLWLDFEQKFSQHDLWRSELRWIEFLRNMPDKIIAMEELKEQKDGEIKESEIQENIDALEGMNI